MRKTTRPHLRAAVLLLILLPVAFADEKPNIPADKALARLKAGNLNFVKGQHTPVNYRKERAALVGGQHPYAILLTCSDSRVPPELIFDQSLGKIFIIRVAGNVADPVDLGSIEYATLHFGCRLLIVLGHASCGAVDATLEGKPVPDNIKAIVRRIQPAADRAKARGLPPAETLRVAIEENVRDQMKNVLSESKVLRDRVDNKLLTVVGGIYQLASGKVEWLASEK